jgi:cardiolipin synthase
LGRLGLLIPTSWRRLHRKLCVVDSAVAFCGGINVLDDLQDPELGVLSSPRLDFSARVTGPLVQDMHGTMTQLWGHVQTGRQIKRLQLTQARESFKALRKPGIAILTPPAGTADHADVGVMATLLLRDNVRNRARIERAYLKAIAGARSEVLIANAYFLPGRKLRSALVHAAKRGVRVRLLLQGRYEYFMQFHGSRPVFGGLLAAGVEIHEYQSGFLHAKVAVVDRHWATLGSSNLDPLSLLLAREANMEVDNAGFAAELANCIDAAIRDHGLKIDALALTQRPVSHRLLDRVAFGIMRMTLYLTGNRY